MKVVCDKCENVFKDSDVNYIRISNLGNEKSSTGSLSDLFGTFDYDRCLCDNCKNKLYKEFVNIGD